MKSIGPIVYDTESDDADAYYELALRDSNYQSGPSNPKIPPHCAWTVPPVPLKNLLLSQVPRIGYFVPYTTNLSGSLNELRRDGYEFIAINLAKKITDEDIVAVCDLLLSSIDWITYTSAFINTEEVKSLKTRRFPFLDLQLNHASHLSLRDIIVQCPENLDSITILARIIRSRMQSSFASSRIHIQLPIHARRAQANLQLTSPPETSEESQPLDSWHYWAHFRSIFGYDRRLGVALELDGDLPDEDELARWSGEAVSMIIIPFILFMPTRQMGVSMPQAYVDFVDSLIQANAKQISIIVKGHVPAHIQPKMVEYLSQFGQRWVSKKMVDEFAVGYEDYLQVPLQPLADDLEASTYEIFEKDPIKYPSYQKAMVRALKRFPAGSRVVVLLVGAGRGPLIRCALSAAEETGRFINLYAIEKNSCAAHTLKNQIWVHPPKDETIQVNKVIVVNTDVRDWDAPEKADIVLSELLGSFGDNELSPECLDGTWKCVKPTAISIPESYRSYVQPLMSNRLYSEACAQSVTYPAVATDFIYVAHMKSIFPMADVQQLFEFTHRDLTTPPHERDNSRFAKLIFKPHTECVLHGFGGYFDTTLIDDITLSIVPETHTEALISWFPVWIPLNTPIRVKPGDKIELFFWRQVTRSKVWYEWYVPTGLDISVQNLNGQSHSVGL